MSEIRKLRQGETSAAGKVYGKIQALPQTRFTATPVDDDDGIINDPIDITLQINEVTIGKWKDITVQTGMLLLYPHVSGGAPGDCDCVDGIDGLSAFEVWLAEGNTGTEQDFIDFLKGNDGKSAYQEWLNDGRSPYQLILESFTNRNTAIQFVGQSIINSGQEPTLEMVNEILDNLPAVILTKYNEQELIDISTAGNNSGDVVLSVIQNGTEQDFLDSLIGGDGTDGGDGAGGVNSSVIEKTYSELETLVSDSELQTGKYYLMTDFQTIYDQPDYSNATTPRYTGIVRTGPTDPIMLLAISPDQFAKEIWRPRTPEQKLEFDFNFFRTTMTYTPAKGRITKCEDKNGNITLYDHTTILFKRYESESGSGVFNSYWDTGFSNQEVLTFGSSCYGNIIGEPKKNYILNNSVFGDNCKENTFLSGFWNNHLGNNCTLNKVHGGKALDDSIGVYGNKIDSGFASNIINAEFYNNVIGSQFYRNEINLRFKENTIGNYFQYNIIERKKGIEAIGFDNNIVGNSIYGNTFKYGAHLSTFGDHMYENEFNSLKSTTFENSTTYIRTTGNKLGEPLHSCTFGGGLRYNTQPTRYKTTVIGADISNVDFTEATHLYAGYHCELFRRQDETLKLRYTDNTDVVITVDPTS